MWRPLIIIFSLSYLGCFLQPLAAHTVNAVLLTFKETGKTWNVEILLDASLSVTELKADDQPQPTREWLEERTEQQYRDMRHEAELFLLETFSFRHRELLVPYKLTFPDFQTTPPDFPHLLNGSAYLTIHLTGELPDKEGDFSIHTAKDAVPDIIVALPGDENLHYLTVQPDSSSILFSTTLSGQGKAVERSSYALLKLGFQHVIPNGLDHILFILGLFLLIRHWQSLLTQSLVFTIAHSLTLGLVFSGAIRIDSWPLILARSIEPLIAISILALALGNILQKKTVKKETLKQQLRPQKATRKRYFIIFAFGLIHGLGFAGSLSTFFQPGSQPENAWTQPLLLTNLGVELAQVSILTIAWTLTIPISKSTHYWWVEKTCSVIIAAVAIWMFFNRVLI